MVLFSLRPWFLQEIDGFPNGIYFFQTRWFLFKEDGPSWSLKVGKLKLKVVVPFGLRFLIRFFGGAAPGCGGGIFQPVETARAASLCTEHTVQNHHLEASLKLFIHYNQAKSSQGNSVNQQRCQIKNLKNDQTFSLKQPNLQSAFVRSVKTILLVTLIPLSWLTQ